MAAVPGTIQRSLSLSPNFGLSETLSESLSHNEKNDFTFG